MEKETVRIKQATKQGFIECIVGGAIFNTLGGCIIETAKKSKTTIDNCVKM